MKLEFQHIFRNSYLALCILLICGLSATAQYDSTKLIQQINAYGYDYKNVIVRDGGMMRIPRDTIRMALRDSGAIAYKNGTLYSYNGRHWISAGSAPDTLVAGAGITLTASGTKKVTIAANTANLDSLYGGKLDSVVKRGDTLWAFAAGDSTLIGTVSGGGGGTLQQAYDAAPTAVPQINAGENYFEINADYDGTNKLMIGGGEGVTLSVDNTSNSTSSSLKATADGSFDIRSTQGGSTHAIMGLPGRIEIVGLPDTSITRIGIGTQSPTVGLDVGVDAKFRKNGTPGTGKVPTGTDANGNWTWQTPTSGGITTAQLTDSINAREPRYKFRDDSTGNAGYTTLYQRDKLKDSLQANIDLKADTFNQTFTGRNTFTSTTSGVIIPRVTTAQMNAISSPTAGEIVYNTDEGATFYYTTDWGWMSDAPEWKRRSGVEQFSEFILQPTATNMQTDFFTTILANSGTIGSATAVSNRPGIYQFSTSTSSNARSSIIADATNASNILLGGGQLMYETDVQIPALSNSTETFRFFVGLSNNTQTVSVSSVAFLYDSAGVNTGSAATGNWQVVCANASSRSYTTTSVPVVAGQWYRLKAVVNADATQVQFFIDGNPVRTETNNIPTTGVTPMAVLTKSAGTTARTALIDWFFFKQKFTTQR